MLRSQLKQMRTELQEEQRKQDARLAALGQQRRQQQLLQQHVARALKKALKAERLLNTHKTSHLEVTAIPIHISAGPPGAPQGPPREPLGEGPYKQQPRALMIMYLLS